MIRTEIRLVLIGLIMVALGGCAKVQAPASLSPRKTTAGIESVPVPKPDVRIESVNLPAGVKVRQPGETIFFTPWTFSFTIANAESLGLHVYWRLESSYPPEITGVYTAHETEGEIDLPAGGKVTVNASYWFKIAGDYQWTYVVESPKGTPVALWDGTLKVGP